MSYAKKAPFFVKIETEMPMTSVFFHKTHQGDFCRAKFRALDASFNYVIKTNGTEA